MNRLHAFALRRPLLVLMLALVVTGAVAPGIARLRLRTDGHALVPSDAPAVRVDDAVRREFGIRDPLVVLVHARHPDGIANPRTLRLVDELTRSFAVLPGLDSASVRSVATERGDRFHSGSLQRRRLLDPLPERPDEIETFRGDVRAIGLLEGTLISEDGASAAIFAGVSENVDRTALLFAAQRVVADVDTTGHDIYVLGAPAAEALLGAHILEDLGVPLGRSGRIADSFAESSEGTAHPITRVRESIARHVGLLPFAILVMALVFLAAFRRISAALLPLAEAGACLVFVFGLMGWTGVPVYLTMAVMPVILVSMGLADEIHVFMSYRRRRVLVPEEPVAESVRAALDETSLAVVATGLTTCIGFLSFAWSPLAPVRAFGIFTAAGILFCMIWTLTVIPALLVLIPSQTLVDRRANAGPSRSGAVRWIRLAARVGSRPLVPLAVAGIALALSLLAARRVVVQDSWIAGFAPESAFYRATEFFNRHFYGTHRLLLAIDTGHVELRVALPASNLRVLEIAIPAALAPDPEVLVGCSLTVSTRTEEAPRSWSSFVETAERRGEEIIVRTPLVHGSPAFLFQPAAGDTLDCHVRSQGFAVPSVLRAVGDLERFAGAQSRWTVGGALGPPDHILAAEFLASDRAAGSRVIPGDPDRVRWLWRSMESAIGEERVREIVNPTLERGLVTLFLKDANFADTARLMKALRDYEREHLAPDGIRFEFAGDVAVSQALIAAIVRSQVWSLLASLVGIAAVSALLFRSVRWGMICMVPAGLAVAATFAALGVSGQPLGVATSMFASMVLGIGVDFAIHLVQRYRAEMSRGSCVEAAVLESLSATGPAILVNALAITLGFGLLVFSRVPATAQLGGITVVSLAGCLAATLLVIPALMVATARPADGPRTSGAQ